jgi:thiamine biosynthesis lipoprotein
MPNPHKLTRADATHRRDFLQGKSAAAALQQLVGTAGEASTDHEPVSPGADTYLVHVSRAAMACQFEFLFNAGQYPQATEVACQALDLVERLEAQLTIYRDTSELSRVNRLASDTSISVEPGLFALLARAHALSILTEGAFDITSGPLSKVWGFHQRAGAIPTPEALAEALDRVGYQHLRLDPITSSIQFDRPGIELNLGAIGKGYALDQCADWLAPAGVDHYLLHGGQSSVIARGQRAGNPHPGWTVGVLHPLRPGKRLLEIDLVDAALATSGAANQHFRDQGKRFGHILDPRTGHPADQVWSSTVIAPTAEEADALSTAFFVLGPTAAEEFTRQYPQLGVILVLPEKPPAGIRVQCFGSAAQKIRRLEPSLGS